jgi:hypothetical protein
VIQEVTMPSIPSTPTLDVKPLYALAGAGDLAVAEVRKRAIEFQGQVRTLPASLRELQAELPTSLSEVPATLAKQAAVVQQRVRTLPGLVQELPALVASNYAGWAERGEQVVAGLRGDTKTGTPAAKVNSTTVTPAASTVGKSPKPKSAKVAKPAAAKPASQIVAETAAVVSEPVIPTPASVQATTPTLPQFGSASDRSNGSTAS